MNEADTVVTYRVTPIRFAARTQCSTVSPIAWRWSRQTLTVDNANPVARFTFEVPSPESYWRAIILFGRNVASYKLALGSALLDIGAEHELVLLDDLALPFARRVADHLQHHDKQGTFQRSQFLDACRAFNRGELADDGLRVKTVQLGFTNVIDAFHVVDNADLPQRFFVDERKAAKAIRLTDQFRGLVDGGQASNIAAEVESRWQLVETAWEFNLPRQLLTVEFDPAEATIVVPRRRTTITGARAALNGYQKGRCFYCYRTISIVTNDTGVCEVDHVFPWSAGPLIGGAVVEGVWNLVLACATCNGWHEKSDRPPDLRYVTRLHRRNEFLIASHHPLRPTLIAQTGDDPSSRAATLRRAFDEVTIGGARVPWIAPEEFDSLF